MFIIAVTANKVTREQSKNEALIYSQRSILLFILVKSGFEKSTMLLDTQQLQNHKRNYTKLTIQQFKNLYNTHQGVQLGKGSYGVVWKVANAQGQEVAIKCFNKNAMKSFKQIIREVDNLRLLQHPNICQFYDCYIVDDSQYYIVIQYCPGGSLASYIKTQPLNNYEKIMICKNIAEGISYAHNNKIVHRDLKPENILIGKGGIAKICDFGCSAALLAKEDQKQNLLTTKVGSPAYWDKRISSGGKYDMTVDIYALGMIFFSIFQGKGIYDQCLNIQAMEQLRSKIDSNFEEKIEELMTQIPPQMKNIIKNCLNPNHSVRYTAAQIVHMLEKELSRSSLLEKLVSTVDQEEIEDEASTFAVGLMSYYRKVDKMQSSLSTRKALFWLLNVSNKNMAQIQVFFNIKYIEPRTKEQYSIIIIFYYIYWLDRLLNLIKREPSEFAYKYPEICPEAVDQKMLERAESHILSEYQIYTPILMKLGRKVNNYMKLIDKRLYLPQMLRSIINRIAIYDISSLNFNEYSDQQLKELMISFYEKRVESQFNRNIKNNEDNESRQQLQIVKNLGNTF